MYPSDELASLHQRKQLILTRSALLRAECVLATAELARPVAWVELAAGWVKRLSPLLAFSSFFSGKRKAEGKPEGMFTKVLRYGPVLLRIFNALRSASRPPGTAAPSP